MIKAFIISAVMATGLSAQTTVYLRASPPGYAQITGASSSGAPMSITTATAHGLNTGDTVVIANVCAVGTGASAANGIRIATVTSTTTFTITDTLSNPITANGAWCSGAANGNPAGLQWVGKLTPFTLGSQPLGVLDGQNGNYMRNLATSAQNGLTSLSVSACPNCVITVSTSFDPTATKIPLTAGESFSVVGSGTGSTRGKLDTCGAGGAEFGPYTVGSVSSTGWTSIPFTCSGLTNGTYTGTNMHCGPAATPNDTIGGTQDCLVVSLLAYTGNAVWNGLIANAYSYYNLNSTTGFKFGQDGGNQNASSTGIGGPTAPQLAAEMFLVDQTNAILMSAMVYYRDNFHKFGGVNWTDNENTPGGNNFFSQDQGLPLTSAAWLFAISSPYWDTTKTQAFIDKIYNDVDDPNGTVCTKAHNNVADPSHAVVLATGTAQATSANSITLSAGDTQADSYYVNNIIVAANGKTCSVSTYVSSIKLATCSANWATLPPSTTAYSIYASASVASLTHATSTTVTGYNTTFTSTFHVGDGLLIGLHNIDFGTVMMFVTAINSDTSMTVFNGQNISLNTGLNVPDIAYNIPQWTTGDCGVVWLEKHSDGIYNSQPALYPQEGGFETLLNGTPATGGNFWMGTMLGHMAAGFAMAGSDARAVKNLAIFQSAWFDFELAHYMSYGMAFTHSGASYAYGTTTPGIVGGLFIMTISVPGFPSMDVANWAYHDTVQYKIMTALPLILGSGNGPGAMVMTWGNETAYPQLYTESFFNYGYMLDAGLIFAPTSVNTQYLRDWLTNRWSVAGINMWGTFSLVPAARPTGLLMADPRIGISSHTAIPHQYLFQSNSPTVCASLTGGVCDPTFRGDAVVSRTGLSSTTDTILMYQSRTWWDDHDGPANGELSLFKAGSLLGADEPSSLPDAGNSGQTDNGIQGNMLQFGGSTANTSGNYGNPPVAGESPIIRWASENHGTWSSQYGDQNSQYVFACSNLAPAYTTVTNYVQRCIAHLKPSTGEEIVVQGDFASVVTPTTIAYHAQYPQTGDTAANLAYLPEGTTTFDGTQVTELEDGGAASGFAPARTFGLLSKFFSPGTITLRDDGTSYVGGFGHTHRISVCGGASCAATVSTYEVVTVHKIAQTLTDTTLTATALNPDTNWTGVQTADKVVLLARGGTTHGTITGFTTTHSGTAQYLFGGLTAGSYAVTVNGTAVTGSPFTVAASDNSIEFTSTAGAVSINPPTTLTGSNVSGETRVNGSVVIH